MKNFILSMLLLSGCASMGGTNEADAFESDASEPIVIAASAELPFLTDERVFECTAFEVAPGGTHTLLTSPTYVVADEDGAFFLNLNTRPSDDAIVIDCMSNDGRLAGLVPSATSTTWHGPHMDLEATVEADVYYRARRDNLWSHKHDVLMLRSLLTAGIAHGVLVSRNMSEATDIVTRTMLEVMEAWSVPDPNVEAVVAPFESYAAIAEPELAERLREAARVLRARRNLARS